MVMSSQKREEEEKRKETEKKEKRKCSKNLYNAYMLFLLYACMCVCVCVCMTFEMAESDSEAALSYVCRPFSHSRVVCPMLLHPHIVHLCVHTHVHTCSRHPPERDCTDVCSYHLRVCSCSSKKYLHYHLSFLMTSWCFLELSCRCRSSRLETHTLGRAQLGLNS